ncbi:unnamed protein product [Adineta steineri]|uniref:Profilin n=1 Tax=Adineta steineri TaxID=433720 RepID=A0A814HZM8_9BILA|nr:unnamed protein product [Adineta steineri]CAF1128167.1 unnamed protein product [Adineta steineri]
MIDTGDQDLFVLRRARSNHEIIKVDRGYWQKFVDEYLVGTGAVSQGAIIGRDGNIWAISPGFELKDGEGKQIVANFKDTSNVSETGVTVGGIEYVATKAENGSIYGEKDATGVILVQTTHAVVIGLYGEKQQPGNATAVTEKLAQYLIENGH